MALDVRARLRSGRPQDEHLLLLLRMRETMTSVLIAERVGMTPEAIRIATMRVKDADLAESGEPPEVVAAHYPWGRK